MEIFPLWIQLNMPRMRSPVFSIRGGDGLRCSMSHAWPFLQSATNSSAEGAVLDAGQNLSHGLAALLVDDLRAHVVLA